MRRILWLVTNEIAEKVAVIADWHWRCGYCGHVTQGGSYGLRAHTYVVHPHMKTNGLPAEEMNQCSKSTLSSTACKPSLRVISSSPTAASPETSARTD